MAEEKIIRPNMQKNFLIARVSVNKEDLKPSIASKVASIFVPVGYSLYYTINGNLTKYEKNIDQRVSGERLLENIGKMYTTLYWIIDDKKHEITVPWGIVKHNDKCRFNGVLKLSIEQADSLIHNYLWQYETELENLTGLRYEYLLEYFVDEKNEQRGVSVLLRDLLIPYLKDCETVVSIKEKISSREFNTILAEMGLKLSSKSVVVNEFKTVGSEDK